MLSFYTIHDKHLFICADLTYPPETELLLFSAQKISAPVNVGTRDQVHTCSDMGSKDPLGVIIHLSDITSEIR